MRLIGVISGLIETSQLPGLRAIDGVRDVEPSRDIHCLDTAPAPAASMPKHQS